MLCSFSLLQVKQNHMGGDDIKLILCHLYFREDNYKIRSWPSHDSQLDNKRCSI